MVRQAVRIALRILIAVAIGQSVAALGADPAKILRVASPDIDTLDPQQFADDPSFQVLIAIFEPLYERSYLRSPTRLVPVTAAGAPEITDGGRTWTMHIKPGIFFTDDPAFKGVPRELVAADYVYAYKRWMDPNLRRGGNPVLADLIIGARALVDAARTDSRMDYDRPIEGLRALDRYTVQIRLNEANYPNIEDLLAFVGAVSREVVEAAGGDIRTRAVGTGPFRLRVWQRGSRLVLEANPGYRVLRFPESDDPALAGLMRGMRGKVLPQIGVVEVNIIEEDLTRLLQFEQGGLDYIVLRGEIANRLLADGKLKPEYAARGVTREVFTEPFVFSLYFNVADPVIGGMSNDRIALRRAIALAMDTETLVKVVYAGQALAANQLVPPGVAGHDPKRSWRPLYDPAAAKALLDRFGYRKLDGDGFRMAADGRPLTLTVTLRSGGISREIQTLVKKCMDAIAVRVDFHVTPFQDAIKELEKGEFQMYFGGFGGSPSGWPELLQIYGKQTQQINVTRFKFADYDLAAEQFLRSATEPEQIAAARKMTELAQTYMPELPLIFRQENDFLQPWLLGFRPPVFETYWKYLDIDLTQRRRAGH
jgi:ABC-type transport system substrate-binding protein